MSVWVKSVDSSTHNYNSLSESFPQTLAKSLGKKCSSYAATIEFLVHIARVLSLSNAFFSMNFSKVGCDNCHAHRANQGFHSNFDLCSSQGCKYKLHTMRLEAVMVAASAFKSQHGQSWDARDWPQVSKYNFKRA
eukprot:4846749-Amphidinium_carterae.1